MSTNLDAVWMPVFIQRLAIIFRLFSVLYTAVVFFVFKLMLLLAPDVELCRTELTELAFASL